jgi:NTE family protein
VAVDAGVGSVVIAVMDPVLGCRRPNGVRSAQERLGWGDVTDDSTLGLTLSGGGAFAAAQVGALQTLSEHGLRPGILTGTSSGALVAAAYAAGLHPDAIAAASVRFRWKMIARWSSTPRWGLLDSSAVTEAIHRVLGEDPLIEDLPRRFGALATDIRTRRALLIDKGPLSTALRASMAVPGILPPVRQGRALLMDGGMIDNVPVAAARQLGATRVIVVRLHARWENVRMMRTATRTADLVRDPTVLLIQPDMQRMAQWSTRDVPALIAEGRRTTEAALREAARDAPPGP